MILGTAAMMALGYGFLAAVLVASCFASHTLLALPVLTTPADKSGDSHFLRTSLVVDFSRPLPRLTVPP